MTKPTPAGPRWTGDVRIHEPALEQALRWKRGRKIFWNAHGDLFHEKVTDEQIDCLFAVCALTPQHTHMILTKRSARMREYLSRPGVEIGIGICALGLVLDAMVEDPSTNLGAGVLVRSTHNLAGALVTWPLKNVWLGVSVEDQQRADERIPDLLSTPASVRFISAEPLLGPVNLEAWLAPWKFCQECDDGEGYGNRCGRSDIPRSEQCPWSRAVQIQQEHGPYSKDGEPASITSEVRKLDWVIVGGESGPKARPMHPDWVRTVRDQCQVASVSFLFKQWGKWSPREWKADGGTHALHRSSLDPDVFQKLAHHPDSIERTSADEAWQAFARIGKAAAGRMLDGREWSEFPA